MKTSETFNELAAALVQAQSEMGHASKDATNPHFKMKYADLASVVDACRGPLTKAKICVVQSPELVRETNVVRVTTRLIHASGQWIENAVEASVARTDPQAIGSAITYLRRYALAALTGVAPDDDDGNASSPSPRPSPRAASPSPARADDDPARASRAAEFDWAHAIKSAETIDQLDRLSVEGRAAIKSGLLSPDVAASLRPHFGARKAAILAAINNPATGPDGARADFE